MIDYLEFRQTHLALGDADWYFYQLDQYAPGSVRDAAFTRHGFLCDGAPAYTFTVPISNRWRVDETTVVGNAFVAALLKARAPPPVTPMPPQRWVPAGVPVPQGFSYAKGPACECGAKATGAADYTPTHSRWCPVFSDVHKPAPVDVVQVVRSQRKRTPAPT